MLTFRNTNIFFIILLALLIWADVRFGIAWYVYVIMAFVYLNVLFYGCYYVGSNFFIKIVCSIKTDKKVIALSFDDGPDNTNTPQIVNLLAQNGITATFFCIGNKIADSKELLVQIDKEGHIIGNHSFSHHFWFDMFSKKEMSADMAMMDDAVVQTIGKTPKLFRPPYGVTNPNLKNAIIAGNYTPVGWSARSLDTVAKDPQKLLQKVVAKIKPGAIFLFHDTSNVMLAILPDFIKHVKSSGYEIIRLDKMLNLQAYA
jgi:peptidoglycan/xylan/chitin deacetylase (PgdA/CDA1 family)